MGPTPSSKHGPALVWARLLPPNTALHLYGPDSFLQTRPCTCVGSNLYEKAHEGRLTRDLTLAAEVQAGYYLSERTRMDPIRYCYNTRPSARSADVAREQSSRSWASLLLTAKLCHGDCEMASINAFAFRFVPR